MMFFALYYTDQLPEVRARLNQILILLFLSPTRISREAEDRLSDIVVDLNLKYNKVFSVIDIDNSVYRKWRKVLPFYQNVDQEGITLWTAA